MVRCSSLCLKTLPFLSLVFMKREKRGKITFCLFRLIVQFFLYNLDFFLNGYLGPTPATQYCNSAKLLLSSWNCLTLLLDLWTLCGKQDVSLLSVLYDSCFLMSSSVMVQTVLINEP